MLALLLCASAPSPAGAAERSRHAGTLAVEHADLFATGRVDERVVLRVRGRSLTVEDARLRPLVGRRVVLSGLRRGDRLRRVRVLRRSGPGPVARSAQRADYPSPPPRTGERRVAVVLLNDPGDEARRWDPAETREAMFGAGSSVAAFVRASSDGRVTVGGDVLGWYTADLGDACNTSTITQRAYAALRADGVDVSDYHYLMVHFPRRGCPFNGIAWIGEGESLINGRPAEVRLLAHELGHNFGLYHANALTCSRDGAPVTLSEECSNGEYGDPFSTMGHNHNLFHGVERARLGWMPGGHHLPAERDGVYTVGGQGGGDVEVLSVPRRLGLEWYRAPTHLAVEMRASSSPFDLFAPGDSAVDGVTIRATYELDYEGMHYLASMPMQLLDATPGSGGGHRDAQLRVGETFVDGRSRAAVTLESLVGGVARVRVGWVPSRPAGVHAHLVEPTAARVAWQASEDDRGVTGYELERDGVVVARTTALEARDDALPAGSDVSFRVVALDGDGNRRPSTSVTLSVPGPAGPAGSEASSGPPRDVTKPRLQVRPAIGRRGRRVPRSRRLVLAGRDAEVGLRLHGAVDGRRIAGRRLARATSGRLVLRIPRRALRGRHLVELVGTDVAGNRTVIRLALLSGRLLRLPPPRS